MAKSSEETVLKSRSRLTEGMLGVHTGSRPPKTTGADEEEEKNEKESPTTDPNHKKEPDKETPKTPKPPKPISDPLPSTLPKEEPEEEPKKVPQKFSVKKEIEYLCYQLDMITYSNQQIKSLPDGVDRNQRRQALALSFVITATKLLGATQKLRQEEEEKIEKLRGDKNDKGEPKEKDKLDKLEKNLKNFNEIKKYEENLRNMITAILPEEYRQKFEEGKTPPQREIENFIENIRESTITQGWVDKILSNHTAFTRASKEGGRASAEEIFDILNKYYKDQEGEGLDKKRGNAEFLKAKAENVYSLEEFLQREDVKQYIVQRQILESNISNKKEELEHITNLNKKLQELPVLNEFPSNNSPEEIQKYQQKIKELQKKLEEQLGPKTESEGSEKQLGEIEKAVAKVADNMMHLSEEEISAFVNYLIEPFDLGDNREEEQEELIKEIKEGNFTGKVRQIYDYYLDPKKFLPEGFGPKEDKVVDFAERIEYGQKQYRAFQDLSRYVRLNNQKERFGEIQRQVNSIQDEIRALNAKLEGCKKNKEVEWLRELCHNEFIKKVEGKEDEYEINYEQIKAEYEKTMEELALFVGDPWKPNEEALKSPKAQFLDKKKDILLRIKSHEEENPLKVKSLDDSKFTISDKLENAIQEENKITEIRSSIDASAAKIQELQKEFSTELNEQEKELGKNLKTSEEELKELNKSEIAQDLNNYVDFNSYKLIDELNKGDLESLKERLQVVGQGNGNGEYESQRKIERGFEEQMVKNIAMTLSTCVCMAIFPVAAVGALWVLSQHLLQSMSKDTIESNKVKRTSIKNDDPGNKPDNPPENTPSNPGKDDGQQAFPLLSEKQSEKGSKKPGKNDDEDPGKKPGKEDGKKTGKDDGKDPNKKEEKKTDKPEKTTNIIKDLEEKHLEAKKGTHAMETELGGDDVPAEKPKSYKLDKNYTPKERGFSDVVGVKKLVEYNSEKNEYYSIKNGEANPIKVRARFASDHQISESLKIKKVEERFENFKKETQAEREKLEKKMGSLDERRKNFYAKLGLIEIWNKNKNKNKEEINVIKQFRVSEGPKKTIKTRGENLKKILNGFEGITDKGKIIRSIEALNTTGGFAIRNYKQDGEKEEKVKGSDGEEKTVKIPVKSRYDRNTFYIH